LFSIWTRIGVRVASLGSLTPVPFIGQTATGEGLGLAVALAVGVPADALGDGEGTVAGLRESAMAATTTAATTTSPTATSAPARERRNCMGDPS
jgi:hypothetical protein